MHRTMIVFAHYGDEIKSTRQYLMDNPGSYVLTCCGNDRENYGSFCEERKQLNFTTFNTNYKHGSLNNKKIGPLTKTIKTLINVEGIQRVITHHPNDVDPDHKIVNQAVQLALSDFPFVELFYAKNPTGFLLENANWDTQISASDYVEYYQTVRRFSL